jgi:hypothetical protein
MPGGQELEMRGTEWGKFAGGTGGNGVNPLYARSPAEAHASSGLLRQIAAFLNVHPDPVAVGY